MLRKRFEDINKYIYYTNNNNLPTGDKFAKIQSLQRKVYALIQQFELFKNDLFIEDQMVPYFRRHPAKMFIRVKSIRFGYKI